MKSVYIEAYAQHVKELYSQAGLFPAHDQAVIWGALDPTGSHPQKQGGNFARGNEYLQTMPGARDLVVQIMSATFPDMSGLVFDGAGTAELNTRTSMRAGPGSVCGVQKQANPGQFYWFPNSVTFDPGSGGIMLNSISQAQFVETILNTELDSTDVAAKAEFDALYACQAAALP